VAILPSGLPVEKKKDCAAVCDVNRTRTVKLESETWASVLPEFVVADTVFRMSFENINLAPFRDSVKRSLQQTK